MYKLAAVARDGEMNPSVKLSKGKVSYPSAKRVHRFDDDGLFQRDIVARRDEEVGGRPLLVDVVRDGEVVYEFPELAKVRELTMETLESLPGGVRRIDNPEEYPVTISDGLEETTTMLEAALRERMGL